MSMKKLFRAVFILIFLPLTRLYSQNNEFSAFLIDNERKPISYASIVFTSKESGTIADSNGMFILKSFSKTDSIKISAISYESVVIAVKDIHDKDTIILRTKSNILSEVVVTTRRKTSANIELGFFNKRNNGSFILRPGAQIAVFIENKNKISGYIDAVMFKLKDIPKCSYSLRIRLLKPNKIIFPEDDMLLENYIIESNTFKKKNYIDISNFNIAFPKEGIFVVLEWLDKSNNCHNPKMTILIANIDQSDNLVWFNYRDRIWTKRRNEPVINGNFMTPNFSLKISY